jgi:hypothetical protein
VEFALLGPDLGDVDVEVADRVGLEALADRLVALGLGQPRSTQRKVRMVQSDEAALTAATIALAAEYGRYGYRRVTALLRAEGWQVNAKRVCQRPMNSPQKWPPKIPHLAVVGDQPGG